MYLFVCCFCSYPVASCTVFRLVPLTDPCNSLSNHSFRDSRLSSPGHNQGGKSEPKPSDVAGQIIKGKKKKSLVVMQRPDHEMGAKELVSQQWASYQLPWKRISTRIRTRGRKRTSTVQVQLLFLNGNTFYTNEPLQDIISKTTCLKRYSVHRDGNIWAVQECLLTPG